MFIMVHKWRYTKISYWKKFIKKELNMFYKKDIELDNPFLKNKLYIEKYFTIIYSDSHMNTWTTRIQNSL